MPKHLTKSKTNSFYSARKDDAILAILTSPTLDKAAEQVGITSSTLRSWMNKPDFADTLYQVRIENIQHALVALQGKLPLAVEILCEIAQDKKQPGSTRVAASKAIIEYSTQMIKEEQNYRIEQNKINALKEMNNELLSGISEAEESIPVPYHASIYPELESYFESEGGDEAAREGESGISTEENN